MFDHIGLRSKQLGTLITFYEAALAPLGITKLVAFDEAAGFGTTSPMFWVGSAADSSSCHIALSADSRSAVDSFYKAAIAAGGKDNGGPGIRAQYSPTYYAAFVVDPDGNNLEVVCHQG